MKNNRYRFNGHGLDKDGFDIFGVKFNEKTKDTYCYNSEGYDADGYDIYGYDIYDIDINGYNKNGYNKDGYDKNGYNKDGKYKRSQDIYGIK